MHAVLVFGKPTLRPKQLLAICGSEDAAASARVSTSSPAFFGSMEWAKTDWEVNP